MLRRPSAACATQLSPIRQAAQVSSDHESASALRTVRLSDGRAVAYAQWGDIHGTPIVYFQGTPSSRLNHPDESISESLGARVITIDRPGFGQSDPEPHRRLLDWPDDVVEVADALGIGRFAVVGISGGGPYVAACAHRIPDRLTGAAIISGGAPIDIPAARQGMARERRWGARILRHAPWLAAALIWLFRHPGRDPDRFFQQFTRDLADCDRAIIDQPSMRCMLIESYAESARGGIRGFLTELRLLSAPWGFRLEEIPIEVHIWHGQEDTSTPPAMARYMAQGLPRCRLRILPGEGHFLLFNHWEEILKVFLCGQERAV